MPTPPPAPSVTAPRKRKLLHTPILAMSILAGVLSIAAALSLISENREHAVEAAERNNSNTARLIGFHVAHVINSGVRLLDAVSQDIEREGMAYYHSEKGKRSLLNRTKGYAELKTLLLISSTGQLLVGASLPFPAPDINYSDRDYFRRHKAGEDLVIGEQLVSRLLKRRSTTISRAIRSASGKLGGIVLITVESAHLSDLFSDSHPTENQEIMILRDDGAVFVSLPELPIGRRFPQAEMLRCTKLNNSGTYEGIGLIDAKPRYFSYEAVKDFPLTVLVSQTRKHVLASWQAFTAIVAGSLVLALALLAATTIYALRSASRTFMLQLELERLAQTDSLTGLANRRYFLEQSEREVSRTARYGGAIGVLMLDIDHFKEINDTYGHGVGDAVLKHLAELFKLELRDLDIVGRLGGEEFAIALPQTDSEQSMEVAERLLKSVRETKISLQRAFPLKMTISIGIACQTGAGNDIKTLLRQADQALYEAKRNGRDRACRFVGNGHAT